MVKKIKNTTFWNVLRRGWAATLALIVVAMSCFVPISAADEPTEPTEPVYSEGLDYTFSGSNATVAGPGTWTGGELRIPPQVTVDGVTYSVTAIGANAFEYNMTLTSLVLPSTVYSLGNYCFRECTSLVSVSGGSSLVAEQYSFYGCTALTSVDFSRFATITSTYAFASCGLTVLDFSQSATKFSLSSFNGNPLTVILFDANDQISAGYILPRGCSVFFSGDLPQYCNCFYSYNAYSWLENDVHLYVGGALISGTLALPVVSDFKNCFAGYCYIETLVVPSGLTFNISAYDCFSNCKNLKNVYYFSNSWPFHINSSRKLFYNCKNLEFFYYGGITKSITYGRWFRDTNTTFVFSLVGASTEYTLADFSNPIEYNRVVVAPGFTDLYSTSGMVVDKGSQFSAILTAYRGYGLPDTVDVTDTSGMSLGWTNGVEYTYNSTTGQFTVPALNQNIQLRAIGVSLVPQYYFFNETPQFIYFVGDRFTFGATDFHGSAVTGAFIRLEDERLCFYQIVSDEDVLVWADDTGWVSPLYRYLDFGSYEVGEDLAYFLRTTATVPSIGSMLSQIYNASGGGSSGGSYDTGYSDGYDVGFEDGRDVGYGEGYDVGFEDGSAVSGGGSSPGTTGTIFDYCTFYVTFNIRNNAGNVTTTERIQIEPTMGVGTIDPSGAIGARYALVDLPGQTVVGCTFYMVWTDLHFFDYTTFPIFVTGEEAPSLFAQMMNVENQSFALVPSLREGSDGLYVLAPVYVDTYPESKNCTEIRMDVATPQMWGVTISTNAEMYSVGYGQGYGEGFQKGSSTSSEQAYNEGMRQGYITGKQEGIAISEKGNFYNLFTSLSDATFGSFLALFNFEILGVNMQTIFGALLTLCVLLIVLFKFTGKKE